MALTTSKTGIVGMAGLGCIPYLRPCTGLPTALSDQGHPYTLHGLFTTSKTGIAGRHSGPYLRRALQRAVECAVGKLDYDHAWLVYCDVPGVKPPQPPRHLHVQPPRHRRARRPHAGLPATTTTATTSRPRAPSTTAATTEEECIRSRAPARYIRHGALPTPTAVMAGRDYIRVHMAGRDYIAKARIPVHIITKARIPVQADDVLVLPLAHDDSLFQKLAEVIRGGLFCRCLCLETPIINEMGFNLLYPESETCFGPAPTVLGSDSKTHLESRCCYIVFCCIQYAWQALTATGMDAPPFVSLPWNTSPNWPAEWAGTHRMRGKLCCCSTFWIRDVCCTAPVRQARMQTTSQIKIGWHHSDKGERGIMCD